MFSNKKTFNYLVISFLFFIIFIIVNLFFYSFITIALYKLICNESDYLSVLLKYLDYKKTNSIYYIINNEAIIYNIGKVWATYSLSEWLDITGNLYGNYNNFLLFDIKYVMFFLDHCFLQVKNNDLNLLFLNFFIRASNLNWINSISLQKTIILNLNESGLFFFRIYNPSHIHVKLVTLYMIYPNTITLYVNKIQCFCFNIIFLYPLELIDLPVLIYINPFFFSSNNYINNIIIYYVIFLN